MRTKIKPYSPKDSSAGVTFLSMVEEHGDFKLVRKSHVPSEIICLLEASTPSLPFWQVSMIRLRLVKASRSV